MINKESIISIFDDKPTLLQWLKKVEAALNNASAVSFNVNKRGNATLTLSIVFEDGSEIESNEFVLEQGESVESAEVVNGVLYLTLTNGDVLNAGNIFNGNITIKGNITINGNVTASGDVEATGALKGASAAITGNVTASGDVEATGALKGASAAITGNVTAGSVTANGGISGQGVAAATQVSTPKLTSFNEQITADKPIIQTLAGISFGSISYENEILKVTYRFAGVERNGNKITFSLFYSVTRKGTFPNNNLQSRFVVPAWLYNKLVSTSIGGVPCVAAFSVYAASSYNVGVTIPALAFKNSGTFGNALEFAIYKLNENFALNTEYFIRQEITLLLGENLAQ